MDGLSVEYASDDAWHESIELLVGIGDRATAQATVTAWRSLAKCPPETLEGASIELVPIDSAADDAVAMIFEADVVSVVFAAGRFGEDLIAIAATSVLRDDLDVDAAVDQLADWMDALSNRG